MVGRVGWLSVAAGSAVLLLAGLRVLTGSGAIAEVSPKVIISEVAWSGTAATPAREWIELYNASDSAVDLTGWQLSSEVETIAVLNGAIEARSFYLLERLDDLTVSDIPADAIFSARLADDGQTLTLWDDGANVVDTANSSGLAWPAGTSAPNYRSMERTGPDVPDSRENWQSNDGVHRNGLDDAGEPINGTPRQPNGGWTSATQEADLSVQKDGPSVSPAGDRLRFTMAFQNLGQAIATQVLLTDTLPEGLDYVADDSGFPHLKLAGGRLVWQFGSLAAGSAHSFNLTVTVGSALSGTIVNRAAVATTVTETTKENNQASTTTIIVPNRQPGVVIGAVYYDGYETGEPDEAVLIRNVGDVAIPLDGWQLTDNHSVATLPSGTTLEGGRSLWLAWQAAAFQRQFGFLPGFETINTHPAVPELAGTWPGFANDGDEVVLSNALGEIQDVLVYEAGNTSQPGWMGEALRPYVVPGVFGPEGQILYRRLDEATGLTVPDTDTLADWAQSLGDPYAGRKVQFPGWDLETFFFTERVTETAEIIVAVAPDNAYEALHHEIEMAKTSVEIESLTLRSTAVAQALADAAARGVQVTVLLEGNPTGGIDDQQRAVCRLLEAAGAQCWFMVSDQGQRIFDRYRYLHAKFVLIDGERVIIGSDNFSPDSMPDDDKQDGTWGRRGVLLITDAPGVVARVRQIWQADFDPVAHKDLFRWAASHDEFGDPPPGTQPITVTGGTSYTVRYPAPATFQDRFTLEVVQSPENSLRHSDGLLGLLGRASGGDTVLVQQLSERPHWGSSDADPADDPNLRLEAYLAAARRGARVRLLLDTYFDDPRSDLSNRHTCDLVNAIALTQRLDLACELANPAGLGIHNKMVLVEIGGRGYVHVGSINGTELANKANREVALQIQSDKIYDYLADMFFRDWPHRQWLPIVAGS